MQTISLTDEEAISFKRWRQYQDTFGILSNAGVFNLSNGSAELHFDSEGKIAAINIHQVAFRRIKVALSTTPLVAITKK